MGNQKDFDNLDRIVHHGKKPPNFHMDNEDVGKYMKEALKKSKAKVKIPNNFHMDEGSVEEYLDKVFNMYDDDGKKTVDEL